MYQKLLALLLRLVKPGYYKQPFFEELCRLQTMAVVEVVPYVIRKGQVYVVLDQRSPNDKYWANEWHLPGCLIRPTDSLEQALNRIIFDELKNPKHFKPKYKGVRVFKNPRGNECANYFTLRLKEIKGGRLFSPKELKKYRYLIEMIKDIK